ncbi:MAG: C39 family peptidase, partial [Alphaproteobacteria bacterium]|nr:C39 family peptidase [Alphaproteobacteria bacterium]
MRGSARGPVNRIVAWALTALLIALVGSRYAAAGEIYLTVPGGVLTPHVKSMRELRFQTVVVQHYDYSCGAAAVATLLTYSYDRPTTEAEPFLQMFRHGDKAKIARLGFSLLDMKSYLASLGYNVSGFRLTLAQLEQIAVPGIALVQVNGYRHFVVIRAVNDTSVLFADPARGMQIISRRRFDKMWDGVLLVIRNDVKLARKGFNEQAFLTVRARAPLSVPVRQPVLGLSVYTEQLFL